MTRLHQRVMILKHSFHGHITTSVRQRRRPLYGYSPPATYERQRRCLQYGYGPTATFVRLQLQYISDAVSE